MKQPKMKLLDNGKTYDVISLVRLDNGKTLRAFPNKKTGQSPTNYVVIKGESEETDIGAELILDN